MSTIRNIYCVGRNYGLHAAELGNAVPESPMIFMKPSHSAFLMDGSRLELPAAHGSVHYEAEIVVRIGRRWERGVATAELLDGFALGLDLTLRDLQSELKKQQYPWLKAKGFRHSAPLTAFLPIPEGHELSGLTGTPFSLSINSEERQRGKLEEAIFGLPELIAHIGEHYGLGEGDLIYTGTPAGVGELHNQDHLALFWNDVQLGDCRLSLE
ncbi:FAA hydrolase family protein [Paenibacillaceae bacterium]|nr:FAA hydrolase family protein [Paenibacillaceae bacterium]